MTNAQGRPPEEGPGSHPPPEPVTLFGRAKRLVFGAPRDVEDPHTYHSMSLIALLAWVGLGADGLSSSAYGPDEAFRALGDHRALAIFLALATGLTVLIISVAYSQIIKHFPFGGGGYVVASRLLGPKAGLVSGSALLVDYILTISVSVASGADAIFSFLPPAWHAWKLSTAAAAILLLVVLNLRGVKESVSILAPIFGLFLLTHAIIIFGGIGSHLGEVPQVAAEVSDGLRASHGQVGLLGLLAIFVKAYSMGGGTYTGIEAVSNGLQIMREPKVKTAQRTMAYMAVSLALTAGGILVLYLLFRVVPEEGKTLNAVLLERITASWSVAGVQVGHGFLVVTLLAEAALLFVAAQAGFIDGPRVMSNMATDSWLPHRFAQLSDRLTMRDGVWLMGGASLVTLIYTHGDITALVTMYSINVFLTFSLSQLAMLKYWVARKEAGRKRGLLIHGVALVLCLSILSGTVYENLLAAQPQASFDDVVQACRIAEIHDVIEKLPNGYNTPIGEHGAGLSGGQKQRIAIARALLKRPKILLFDEAASSLDQATAEQFARTINQLKGKVTMLFIAHQIPKGLKVDEVVMLGPSETQMGVISGDKT